MDAEPDIMAEAARIVAGQGASLIDINMGCPVKKVIKAGAGAILMKDPDRVASIITAVNKSRNCSRNRKNPFRVESLFNQCCRDCPNC